MNKFKSFSKRIWATTVTVIGAVALVGGIWADIPPMLADFANQGPTWFRQAMSNPDVWWSAGVTSICIVVIWAIWRMPDADDFEADIKEAASFAADLPPRYREMTYLLIELYAIRMHWDRTQRNEHSARLLLEYMATVIPNRIQDVFDSDAKEVFVDSLERASNTTKHVDIIWQACVPTIESRIRTELTNHVKRHNAKRIAKLD